MGIEKYLPNMKGMKNKMVTGLAAVVLTTALCAIAPRSANAGNVYQEIFNRAVTEQVARDIADKVVDAASDDGSEQGRVEYKNKPEIVAYKWDDKDGDGYVSGSEIGGEINGPLDTSKYGVFFSFENPLAFGAYDSNGKLITDLLKENRRIKKGTSLPEKITIQAMDRGFQMHNRTFELNQK